MHTEHNYLKEIYKEKKAEIESRLMEFEKKGRSSDKTIFSEMCFCILTPQSRAVNADKSIRDLVKTGDLFTGSKKDIRKHLSGVRFPNNKTKYIIRTRKEFKKNGKISLKDFLSQKNLFLLRKELVKRVTGFGLKEASHFMRNIGKGENIAILDRHILNELVKYRVIKKFKSSLYEKEYIKIEDKMRKFSQQINIPLDALDLLLWYKETGFIFK